MSKDIFIESASNYTTWCVYKDIFRGKEQTGLFDLSLPLEQLRHVVQDYAQHLIHESGGGEGNIAVDYALAYLSDVNWYEIAHFLICKETA